jgi:bacillithiol biosynthesis cysteine-adding enzyme BshC
MQPTATYLSYDSTGYFSTIVSDYLSQAAPLQPFYKHTADLEGIAAAIKSRKAFDTPRATLVEALQQQYKGLPITEKLNSNIASLTSDHTFTVTTAHQPNIFTGPLYFIYKILHAIRLADELNNHFPDSKFVPVYYMGSEDADLEELGVVHVGGQKLRWETKQTGAVGRMKVDKNLIRLIHAVHGQAGVLPFGKAWTDILLQCYTEGKTIQQATLELLNILFGAFGLVVLIPDAAALKQEFSSVVQKELLEQFSHKVVTATIAALEASQYKVQAGGRELNLFYLIDNQRERIEKENGLFVVKALSLSFTGEQILQELREHPERFSANVILRGAFQETILPNIVFIGGGGELAYWLELKNVFAAVDIPYPVLMLRNSFLLLKQQHLAQWQGTGHTVQDLFTDTDTLITQYARTHAEQPLELTAELGVAQQFYADLRKRTDAVDASLSEHLIALEKQALKKLHALEKKLLRAEKKKHAVINTRITQLRSQLFPNNSLQERIDNFSLWYATYGPSLLQSLYNASTGFNAGFGCVVVD